MIDWPSIRAEQTELLKRKTELALSKKDHEIKLVAIKNLIRSGGRLPSEKYRQCCNAQNTHNRAILHIENLLASVTSRLREIARMEDDAKDVSFSEAENGKNPVPMRSIIVELVALRQEYQNFAADGTRVASMRQMAAEFVVKLNPIIKQGVGSDAL